MPSRRSIAVWSIASLLGMLIALAFFWFREHKFVDCTTEETSVPDATYDHKVVIVNRVCDGIASSDDISIEVVDALNSRVPVLQYGTAYSFVKDASEATPEIRWKNKDTLSISVKKVAYIKRQVDRVDGIRVQTHIDEVMFK